jgi:hypothetical protein
MLVGGAIIIGSMVKGRRSLSRQALGEVKVSAENL